jgi:hypothetical protein
MMLRKAISIGSSLALVCSAGLAIWAIALSARGASGQPPRDSIDIPPPTPTVAGIHDGDEAGLLTALRDEAPTLANAIDAAHKQDFEAFFAAFHHERSACTPDDFKGGPAPFCSGLGLPQGGTFDSIREDFAIPRLVPVEQARSLLAEVMVGTSPRVELVARHTNGTYVAAFRIEPVPDAGTPNAFEHVTVATDTAGRPVSFHRTYGPSTPLDTLRLEEGYGREKLYEVLWVSEELKETESTRERTDPTR